MRQGLSFSIFAIVLAGVFWLFTSADHKTPEAVNYEEKSISLAIETEPPTLNTMGQVTSTGIFFQGHCFEGLMRSGPDGKLTYGVAKNYQYLEDGKKIRFDLRRNARWSDGKAVTAQDFVFSWRKILEPKTASIYAFILYFIKNGEAINKEDLASSNLGVTAIDEWTLEVEFEQSCPFFLELTSFVSYMPCRQDFFEKHGENYALDADKMLYNGPFVVSDWQHSSSLQMKKNPHYWNAKAVKIDTINIPYMISDPLSLLNLFIDEKIIFCNLNKSSVSMAMNAGLHIERNTGGYLSYIEMNKTSGEIFNNRNLRLAIQSVIDHKTLVNKVLGTAGTVIGKSIFPQFLPGENKTFRQEFPMPESEFNPEQGRQYLALAKQELKLQEFPEIRLLLVDQDSSKKIAEFLQESLSQHLGLKITLDVQTFKQRLAKMNKGDFDLAVTGWGPDYNDCMTFGDLFASWNENNRGQYKSDAYDSQVRIALKETDIKKRMLAFDQMQKIIRLDAAIIPLFEQGGTFVKHPRIKGMTRQVIGADPDFCYAEILAPTKK